MTGPLGALGSVEAFDQKDERTFVSAWLHDGASRASEGRLPATSALLTPR